MRRRQEATRRGGAGAGAMASLSSLTPPDSRTIAHLTSTPKRAASSASTVLGWPIVYMCSAVAVDAGQHASTARRYVVGQSVQTARGVRQWRPSHQHARELARLPCMTLINAKRSEAGRVHWLLWRAAGRAWLAAGCGMSRRYFCYSRLPK